MRVRRFYAVTTRAMLLTRDLGLRRNTPDALTHQIWGASPLKGYEQKGEGINYDSRLLSAARAHSMQRLESGLLIPDSSIIMG